MLPCSQKERKFSSNAHASVQLGSIQQALFISSNWTFLTSHLQLTILEAMITPQCLLFKALPHRCKISFLNFSSLSSLQSWALDFNVDGQIKDKSCTVDGLFVGSAWIITYWGKWSTWPLYSVNVPVISDWMLLSIIAELAGDHP